MSSERVELSKEQRSSVVDQILASPTHFDAFLAFESVTRAEIAHLGASTRLIHECNLVGGGKNEDQTELKIALAENRDTAERLKRLRDLVGQQRVVDLKFATAYQAIRGALVEAGVSVEFENKPNFGGIIEVFDQIRQDYRIPLVELAHRIKRDPEEQETFQFYGKLRKVQLEQQFTGLGGGEKYDEAVRLNKELTNKGEEAVKTHFQLKREIQQITQLSGAQGPFAEQYIIETIENIIDPELKKERDRKAGKGRAY